ncbi:ArsR/SmtB family transcription factor [Paraburkholderia metrosideri]|uniref:ArsR family transcriptional regulator n=1 Tax=Paraburkholderia metrosideri TaxID=580937 RepID=A0ABN7IAG6_9BURK|nr:helix-turn-helix transcriptional regulator [Paraburkholderia metrosideri]CAD6553727.1 hypothetical protein LMG28140_05363 [Paraburkholderia metrosideri]
MIDENLIYKALANPFRRDVLKWLKTPNQYFRRDYVDVGRGVPLHAILALSGLSQPTVSAHVTALIEARLLVATRVSQWLFVTRNEEVIRGFTAQLGAHL